LRGISAELPSAEEYVMVHHPAFRAGKKPYAIAGSDAGAPTLSIKVDLMDQPLYLRDSRFSITHYIGHHGWITMRLADGLDAEEIGRLVVASYRRVAGKKMLKALDARSG
ncbi:MAG TPA: MmcQ/YjbR family DNA-binding protein, partial [Oscillatoriaceae cyanobacterium]